MRFCDKLDMEMEQLFLTVEDVSTITGIPPRSVYNHLSGCTFPSRKTFRKYATKLFGLNGNLTSLTDLYYVFKIEEGDYGT